MSFFNIEMLPAKHGDALLLEYGTERAHRVLIDGGPLAAYPEVEKRLMSLADSDRTVELLVITHVDTDHIEGIIRLLAAPRRDWLIAPQEVWFNGWRHLQEAHELGGREGELVSALLARRLNDRWNTHFGGKAVRVQSVPDDRITLEGGVVLTMLSPDEHALEELREDWRKSVGKWDLTPGDLEKGWKQLVEEKRFHPNSALTLGPEDLTEKLRRVLKGRDPAKANGSSIGFVAEYGGKTCMCLGDAHMSVVCASLRRLGATAKDPLIVNAVKMAHHGSKNNFTQEFLTLVDAEHFLFSSNGDKFGHPDKEVVEAVICGARKKPTVWFNYRSEFTSPWQAGAQIPDAKYDARYPSEGDEGIVVPL